jgi:hypothetical protein
MKTLHVGSCVMNGTKAGPKIWTREMLETAMNALRECYTRYLRVNAYWSLTIYVFSEVSYAQW